MAVLSLYHSARTPLTHCRISYQSLLPDPVDLAVFDRAARDQSIEIHSTENGFFNPDSYTNAAFFVKGTVVLDSKYLLDYQTLLTGNLFPKGGSTPQEGLI
jgi:hypothetical protein